MRTSTVPVGQEEALTNSNLQALLNYFLIDFYVLKHPCFYERSQDEKNESK